MYEKGHIFICATKGMGCNLPSGNNSPGGYSIAFNATLLFLLLFAFPLIGPAQFYEYGQDRGTIRWNHFSTDHFQLIYPRGIDSLAMDFADKLEYFYPYQAEVMQHGHKKCRS
jgi:hypothetical protein